MNTSARELEDRYFRRMAAGIGDKRRILPWLNPGSALDVGAGEGSLARVLAATGHETTAIDASRDAVVRLRSSNELRVDWLRADEVNAERLGYFDNIVCSSVLHEVYSYGDGVGRGKPALDKAFSALTSVLRPGGRFIIRDGIMPDCGNLPASLSTPDRAEMEAYLDEVVHPELMLTRQKGRGHSVYTGTRHAVAEAALTVSWGQDTFHREAKERYMIFTASEYIDFALDYGLAAIHRDAVTQPGYVVALKHLGLRDSNGGPWFPATNGLWVFEKRGA